MSMHTVNSPLQRPDDFEPDDFYSTPDGTTLVGPEDLEEIIPNEQKPYLDEVQRYWLNKPYSFAVIYHSRLENEYVYYAIEPTLTEKESRLRNLLDEKIRVEIDYDAVSMETPIEERITLLQSQARELLRRWDLIRREDLDPEEISLVDKIKYRAASFLEQQAEKRRQSREDDEEDEATVRSAPVFFDDDGEQTTLTADQIEKMVYYLVRDFVGYARIDPLKNDIAIEDISCNGPGEELFIDHQEFDQLRVANIRFDQKDLLRFVTTLANMNGHGISRRQPEVDATLRDGSRAKLTLADEISTKGSNFTIRQFLDIPYTPVDLVSWGTFNIDQMAYLWLCIEHGRSMIFAGGTASGKTTTLNAVNLFAPASEKFVTIEDTAELELPQKNWVASITRPAVTQSGDNEIEEFDLVKHALRMRPKYIIMGEVRGEEGNALFQAMGSGHTSYTTFHADDPDQLIKRFSSDQIGVQKSYMDMIDAVVMLEQTRTNGETVRRSPEVCEIQDYDQDADVLNRQTLYNWDPREDSYRKTNESHVLEDIRVQYGWTEARLERELQKRRVVLADLIKHGFNTYGEVAGTIQGFMRDEDAILNLIAENELEDYLENLQNISTLDIDVDEEREALVPRPDPDDATLQQAEDVLQESDGLLSEHQDYDLSTSFAALEEADQPSSGEVAAEADSDGETISPLERALTGDDEEDQEVDEAAPPEEDDLADPIEAGPPAEESKPAHPLDSVVDEDSPATIADADTPGENGQAQDQPDPTADSADQPLSASGDSADDQSGTVSDSPSEQRTDDSLGASEPVADTTHSADESPDDHEYPERCIAVTKKNRQCRHDVADGNNYFCHLPAHNADNVDDVADGWRCTDAGVVAVDQPDAEDAGTDSVDSGPVTDNQDGSDSGSSLVPEATEIGNENEQQRDVVDEETADATEQIESEDPPMATAGAGASDMSEEQPSQESDAETQESNGVDDESLDEIFDSAPGKSE